jgi:hypothetical protein
MVDYIENNLSNIANIIQRRFHALFINRSNIFDTHFL